MMIPFTLFALAGLIGSIIYVAAFTDGTINIVSLIILPVIVVASTIVPVFLHSKMILSRLCFGLWSFSVYNVASLNLIPIYTYANIDDFDVEQNCPSDEERKKKVSTFNMAKFKLFLLYIFLNGVVMFVFCEGRFSDTWKLKFVEIFIHFYSWTFFFKAIGTCYDKIRFETKEKNERKLSKEDIKTYFNQERQQFVSTRNIDKNRQYKNKGFMYEDVKEPLISEVNIDQEMDKFKDIDKFNESFHVEKLIETKEEKVNILAQNRLSVKVGEEIDKNNFAAFNENIKVKYDSFHNDNQVIINIDDSKIIF